MYIRRLELNGIYTYIICKTQWATSVNESRRNNTHITQHISAVRLYTAAAYYLCGDSGRQLLEYNKLLTHQQQLSDFYFLFFFFFLFFNLHAGLDR